MAIGWFLAPIVLALSISTPAGTDAAPLVHAAIGCTRRGDLDQAIALCTAAIRTAPRDVNAYYWRGDALYRKGDVEGALADFGATIRLAPDQARLWVNRGIVRHKKGDLDGAIADFSEAMRRAPADFSAVCNRGETRLDACDYAGALEDLTAALRIEPRSIEALNNRGIVRALLGDTAGAIADYTDGLRARPREAYLRTNRARARALAGDKAGALEDLRAGARLDPEDVYAPLWIACLGGGTDALEPFAEGCGWPACLARLVMGTLRPEEALEWARGVDVDLVQRQRLCEAYGYAGLLAERDGDAEAARRAFEACVATRVTDYIEYQWARVRLAPRK